MTDDRAAAGEDRSRVERDRLATIEALRASGVEPYAYSFDVTHSAADVVASLAGSEGEGPSVRSAGRLVALRNMGRSVFAHIADRSGRVQLYFKLADLDAGAVALLDLLDLGDWIGVEGPVFRTRTGEITVRVERVELLAKTVRPLPLGKQGTDPETGSRVVFSGISDREMRYRQRYVDLAVSPETREVFIMRARTISAMRRFLDSRGFLEVETPVLQPVYGGASARPFISHHHSLDMPLYLRIADELYLKRLIVGGLERVYESSFSHAFTKPLDRKRQHHK